MVYIPSAFAPLLPRVPDEREIERSFHEIFGSAAPGPGDLAALRRNFAADSMLAGLLDPARSGKPFDIPFAAICGRDDTSVSEQAMSEWQRHTTRELSLTILPGDHFLFRDGPHEPLLAALEELVVRRVRPAGATPMYQPGFSNGRSMPSGHLLLDTLPPLLRAIIVTDGTVTKLLEAFLWETIDVRVLVQRVVEALPPGSDLTGDGGVLHRQVILVGRDRKAVLAYAVSNVILGALNDELRHALLSGAIGIGALLQEKQLETYRQPLRVVRRAAQDNAGHLEVAPGAPVVERKYLVHLNRRPAIEITEVFPLERYRLSKGDSAP
jgi:chorismate-pyruvate lyase